MSKFQFAQRAAAPVGAFGQGELREVYVVAQQGVLITRALGAGADLALAEVLQEDALHANADEFYPFRHLIAAMPEAL